ncbi:MAG TPA: AAA family ATPase [Polyangiaceae bacterium]|jgi:ATP-dependent Clp protease ATP-binding subunit ClpA|nr:AAA family ATPase [Polyangiaceae bacterium]
MSKYNSFKDLYQDAAARARSSAQVLSLAHLYQVCLEDCTNAADPNWTKAAQRIGSEVLVQLDKKKLGHQPSDNVVNFQPQRAIKSYELFARDKGGGSASLADSVLEWLLKGDFTEESTQSACREICRRAGLVASKLDAGRPILQGLAFGESFAHSGVEQAKQAPMFGREAELQKHLGLLTLALRQKEHYLLVGKSGVGKSLFLRHLLATALANAQTLGLPNPNSLQFALFGRRDFVGSETENKERFGRLFSYLQQNPDVVPVFDELEHILRYAPKLAEHFSAMFGGALTGEGRTFVLACESSVASTTSLLKGIQSSPLPVLTAAATRQFLSERLLPDLCERYQLAVSPSAAEFTNAVLEQGPSRYPNRFFPDLAVHLATSAVNRARNRITFLQTPPESAVTIQDLWSHIADEQGLNPEVFGKDPKEFYAHLRQRLTSTVIGQDHAVNRICDVLESQANRPPQRAPRGRFLFVGPPGVGKTQLARSLAEGLGLGEEAFFVFNMSEYNSEAARTRFMGADPGYVGFNNTRTIYQAVRERPACVILLDEIDRSDASIQDILLSIMEGEGKDAEGQSVYFSQAIFVMTTNLGQEAVQAAYEQVRKGEIDRAELVKRFHDESLRRLVLEGAIDDAEIAMQGSVDRQISDTKRMFMEANNQGDDEAALGAVDRYSQLKGLRTRLQQAARHSPLDRALLDRVDFIIPFFPLKEEALLRRIMELKLKAFGWNDCPDATKEQILRAALAEKESIRPLERLIKKYLCDSTQAPAN